MTYKISLFLSGFFLLSKVCASILKLKLCVVLCLIGLLLQQSTSENRSIALGGSVLRVHIIAVRVHSIDGESLLSTLCNKCDDSASYLHCHFFACNGNWLADFDKCTEF